MNRADARVILGLPEDHPIGEEPSTFIPLLEELQHRADCGLITVYAACVQQNVLTQAHNLVIGRESEPGEEQKDLMWAQQVLGCLPPATLEDLGQIYQSRTNVALSTMVAGDQENIDATMANVEQVSRAYRIMLGHVTRDQTSQLRAGSVKLLEISRNAGVGGLLAEAAPPQARALPAPPNLSTPSSRREALRTWTLELVTVPLAVMLAGLIIALVIAIIVGLFAGGNAHYRFGYAWATLLFVLVMTGAASSGSFVLCLWPSRLQKKPPALVWIVSIATACAMIWLPLTHGFHTTLPTKSCEQAAKDSFADIQHNLAESGSNDGPFSYGQDEADYVASICP